jgi:SAM-dependent methyltransferase
MADRDPSLFDRVADSYDRARPPYPPELYAALRELSVLGPGLRVLEVGAGSGQATPAFVDAGAEVTAVEPGEHLARRLRERLPQVRVINGPLEEAVLPESAYDVAVSATALHWVDLAVGLPLLHRALVPGGLLAAWWNVFGDPSVRTPFREVVDEVTARRTPRPPHRPSPVDTGSWSEELSADGWFLPVQTRTWSWQVDLDASQVHDLFSTFSDWTDDEVDEVTSAAERLGGVTEHYRTVLYVLQATTG